MQLNFYCSKCGAELRIAPPEEKAIDSDRLMLKQEHNSYYVAPCAVCVNTAEVDRRVEELHRAIRDFKGGM